MLATAGAINTMMSLRGDLSTEQLHAAVLASNKHELLRALTPALRSLRVGSAILDDWAPVLVTNQHPVRLFESPGCAVFDPDMFVSWKPFCTVASSDEDHGHPVLGSAADASLIADGCFPEVYYATVATGDDMEAEFLKLDIARQTIADSVQGMFFNGSDFWLFEFADGLSKRLVKSQWALPNAACLIKRFLGDISAPPLLNVLREGMGSDLQLLGAASFLGCTAGGRIFKVGLKHAGCGSAGHASTTAAQAATDLTCVFKSHAGAPGSAEELGLRSLEASSSPATDASRSTYLSDLAQLDKLEMPAAGLDRSSIALGREPLSSEVDLIEKAALRLGDFRVSDTAIGREVAHRLAVCAASPDDAGPFKPAATATSVASRAFELTVVVYSRVYTKERLQRQVDAMAAAAKQGLPIVPPQPESFFTGPHGGGFLTPLIGRPVAPTRDDIEQAFESLWRLHRIGVLHGDATLCKVMIVGDGTAKWTGMEVDSDPEDDSPMGNSLFTMLANHDACTLLLSCLRTLRTSIALDSAGAGGKMLAACSDAPARGYDSLADEVGTSRIALSRSRTLGATAWAKVQALSEANVGTGSTLPAAVKMRKMLKYVI